MWKDNLIANVSSMEPVFTNLNIKLDRMDLQDIKDELKEMYPSMQSFIQHTLVAEMCLKWHKKQVENCSISNAVCNATSQIKTWLDADDSGRIWKQGENPNCFTNNRLEALYVYDDHIKYWKDIRAQNVVIQHRIPESKSELYLII